ncbi:MAG: DUF368 domain-containing protein [Gammaproteobacteria bacterium]|nr:MAG: DUF368 domain-containing protein [Gammaproteobacteria bacterium]
MGVAELIPGISGSTVALLFGIYKNLIQILSELKFNRKTFTLDYLKNKLQISLIIFLIIPMFASLILFAELINFLIENYNFYFYRFLSLLMLVIGIYVLKIFDKALVFYKKILLFLIGSIFGSLIGLIDIQFVEAFHLFFGWIYCIFFFLIPGISGSAILVSIGLYETMINSIATANLPIISSFLLGALVALILMPRFIKRIYFRHNHKVDSLFAGLIVYSGIILL